MSIANKIAWDDTVLPFQLDRCDMRGRVARLDGVLGNNDGDVIDDFNFGLRRPDGSYDDEAYEDDDVRNRFMLK